MLFRSLALALVHDHPDEVVYGKPEFLEAARQRGWMIVSMKQDFLRLWGRPAETPVPEPASRALAAGWWFLWLGAAGVAVGAAVLVRRRRRPRPA